MKPDGLAPDFLLIPALPEAAMAMVLEHEEKEQPKETRPKAKSILGPLENPQLDARRYVTLELCNALAAEVDLFTTKLMALQEGVEEEIRNNVNKSYEKILVVSNDLQTTELELKTIKSSLAALQEVCAQMRENALVRAAAAASDGSRNRNSGTAGSGSGKVAAVDGGAVSDSVAALRRSSIALLHQRWVSELDLLFRHVEGAQKLLSAVSGRHVLAESGRWHELNAATWRPLHGAHLFILNDHVLIAKAGARSKLEALHCWPMRDIQMTEVDQLRGHTLSFKARGANYVFHTERAEEHAKVVLAFKKAQAQLRELSEEDARRQRLLRDLMQILLASDRTGKRSLSLLLDLSARVHTRADAIEDSGLLRVLRGIDDTVDEIDIKIAHHRFKEAVDLALECGEDIESARKKASDKAGVLLDVLRMKLDQRRSQLETALVFELGEDAGTVEAYIGLLKALGLAEVAKENLLLVRSKMILRLTESVEFEGDLPDYLAQVSIIRFQIIKSTAELFQETFPEPKYSSDIIKWCTEEVKKHADMLRKQLFDVKVGLPIHKLCVDITRKQVEELRGVGLDVEFLLSV